MKQVRLNVGTTSFNEVDACMAILNEEDNIKGCLENIYDVVDDIHILDGGSIDGTIQIIKEFPDPFGKIKLYKNDFFKSSKGILGDQKNLVMTKADSLFILFIDPDEKLNEPLRRDFRKIIRENQDKDMINFKRHNFINGKPEKLAEEFQYRLFKSFVRYVGVSHHEASGWSYDYYTELPDEYFMIHNKTFKRSNERNNFYNNIDSLNPHKSNVLSRLIRYEVK